MGGSQLFMQSVTIQELYKQSTYVVIAKHTGKTSTKKIQVTRPSQTNPAVAASQHNFYPLNSPIIPLFEFKCREFLIEKVLRAKHRPFQPAISAGQLIDVAAAQSNINFTWHCAYYQMGCMISMMVHEYKASSDDEKISADQVNAGASVLLFLTYNSDYNKDNVIVNDPMTGLPTVCEIGYLETMSGAIFPANKEEAIVEQCKDDAFPVISLVVQEEGVTPPLPPPQ